MGNIYVTIRNRSGLIFSGKVLSITSSNENGSFDILPNHGQLISLIEKFIILRLMDKTNKEILMNNGVMRVYQNVVNIIIGVKTSRQN